MSVRVGTDRRLTTRDFRLYRASRTAHIVVGVMLFDEMGHRESARIRARSIAPFVPAILLLAWPLLRSLF